jgi:hypothetical protein
VGVGGIDGAVEKRRDAEEGGTGECHHFNGGEENDWDLLTSRNHLIPFLRTSVLTKSLVLIVIPFFEEGTTPRRFDWDS